MKLSTLLGITIFVFTSFGRAEVYSFLGDGTRGEKLSVQCSQCHGANGITDHGMHPNLAGQNVMYLVRQLHAFKNDTRIGHHMNDIAKALSDQDIDDLASYYHQINICE